MLDDKLERNCKKVVGRWFCPDFEMEGLRKTPDLSEE
jgi:hypothetical protein